MTIKQIVRISLGLMAALLLTACGKTAVNEPPNQSDLLLDTEWQLIALNNARPVTGSTTTLRFDVTTVHGNGGCNTYSGNYAASANNLAFSDVYWTEMGCMEPEGILEQEQTYFDLIKQVTQYNLSDNTLDLLDETGKQILEYTKESAISSVQASSERGEPVTRTGTESTASSPSDQPAININVPLDYQPIVDPTSEVAIWVPDTWSYALPSRDNTIILQSYPSDKYIGGEARKSGDTKCDFTVHPEGTDNENIMPRDQQDPEVIVISMEDITLRPGQTAQRFEVESMGRAYVVVTMIGDRPVTLTCFGNPEPLDVIASTLSVMPEIPLRVDLTPESSTPAGSALYIDFSITNASVKGLYLLTWFIPLEGLNGDFFKVQHEGSVIDYQGKMVKRGDPLPEEYVWLESGESLSVVVDLSEGYDVSQPGEYSVRFRSPRFSDIAFSQDAQAISNNDRTMIWLPSEPITVTISEP